MLQRLILEIELNVVIVGAVTHRDIEEDLDGAFGDRSQLVRLAELNVVPANKSWLRKLDQRLVAPSVRAGSKWKAITTILTGARCRTRRRRIPG